ncbi:hypothetical protein ACQ33O_11365 [Ferruginibacter sp. SUN002]|uniref:hypothetical protein n=1 Tax=Ferruginibacter sp. SUN002 TaxID=2937789 RepID=UPI003D365B0E
MRLSLITLFIICSGFFCNAFGQDTLPQIKVKKALKKVIISWKNAYGRTISTINIQRSSDSIKQFSTIGTVLNPMNRDNGFVDAKPPADKVFYRVFVAFSDGSYIFTRSYQPSIDTVTVVPGYQEVVVTQPTGFTASKYIYTGKENNVVINIPNAAVKKYSVKFFDANNNFLFEIKKIPEPFITLEKVNFKHAGWFNFQLFEEDILIEKYQFYISKDSKKTPSNNEQGR